jgi:hypothetical protein
LNINSLDYEIWHRQYYVVHSIDADGLDLAYWNNVQRAERARFQIALYLFPNVQQEAAARPAVKRRIQMKEDE